MRVLVTRPTDPESDLVASLERHGATVDRLPLVEIGPPPDERALQAAVDAAESFAWIAFASSTGVESFARRRAQPLPRVLPHLAAVGPTTARALEAAFERAAEVVPEIYSGEALADALVERVAATESILVVQALDARPALTARLRGAGRSVTTIAAYSTVAVRPRDLHERLRSADAIVLTSPSAAHALVEALGGGTAAAALRGKLIACIGPVTLFEAHQLGLHVEVVPESSTFPALVEALCTYYSARPPAR
ncbi:MAG TPA: uroporphyrinogen-III synthase [Candidatus Acidoferrales bacterium]|nr:uroporphyrinogen-III synthase [Candidatus Acidoferrales bacterium]